MRCEFEMTKEQLDRLLDACKPVPLIMIHIVPASSPQQRANDAWNSLGREIGFDGMTVQPVSGKGMRFFTAEPV